MRTNIDIDDELLGEAMELTGLRTKKAVVEEALAFLIRIRNQRRAFDEMRGLGWEGNLEEMRLGWSPRVDE